jgi:ABC-type nickel/cobalt efflux system permease component RcnA
MQAETGSSTPPPTQEAYKPMTREDLRNGILVSVTCLIISAIGAALWVFGLDFIVGSADWRTEWNALVIALATPLMLIAAIYFFYTTWRGWQRSSHFHSSKQRVRGVITHLWSDKDASGRKRYNVGYQYAEAHTAYQSVHKRRYDSLSVGGEVWVEYVPNEPKLSYFEPVRKQASRKKVDTV